MIFCLALWPGGQVTRQKREDRKSLVVVRDNVAAGGAYIVGPIVPLSTDLPKKFGKYRAFRKPPDAASALAPN